MHTVQIADVIAVDKHVEMAPYPPGLVTDVAI